MMTNRTKYVAAAVVNAGLLLLLWLYVWASLLPGVGPKAAMLGLVLVAMLTPGAAEWAVRRWLQ